MLWNGRRDNMKKAILAAALALALLFSAATGAETDIQNMDFDALSKLKQTVDAEFASRPEAGVLTLVPGQYVVGRDLKAGRYLMMCNDPSYKRNYARLHVYKDEAQFAERPAGYYGEYISDNMFTLGEAPESVVLAEGNLLCLDSAGVVCTLYEFAEEDYYRYTPPEGTCVPAGSYLVGEEGNLPAGNYEVFAADVQGGEIRIYFKEEDFFNDGSWHLGCDKHYDIDTGEKETIKLEEGYLLFVEKDVVMTRQKRTKLVFD